MNLKKNLLPLEALNAQEYKFSGANKGIKFTKGSMIILKGERTAKLYKIIESAIVGDATVAADKEDTTKLWHMRLGCMSERGLQVLHKKGCYTRYQISQS